MPAVQIRETYTLNSTFFSLGWLVTIGKWQKYHHARKGLDDPGNANPEQLISSHPEGNTGANLESSSHRCHPILEEFVWDLTKESINLPLGCLQGGLEFEVGSGEWEGVP